MLQFNNAQEPDLMVSATWSHLGCLAGRENKGTLQGGSSKVSIWASVIYQKMLKTTIAVWAINIFRPVHCIQFIHVLFYVTGRIYVGQNHLFKRESSYVPSVASGSWTFRGSLEKCRNTGFHISYLSGEHQERRRTWMAFHNEDIEPTWGIVSDFSLDNY